MRFDPPFTSARPARRWALLLLAVGAPLACTGVIDAGGEIDHPSPGAAPGPSRPGGAGTAPGGGAPGTAPAGGANACATDAPGVPTLRRLTSEELARSLKALLGREVALGWPQDELVAGYAGARENFVPEPHARALYTALLPALRRIVASSPAALSDACAAADGRCAASLVGGFAARAWRRAPSPDERTSLLAFHERAQAELGDGKEAIANLLLAILSLPSFLYRSELGVRDGAERRLSSREVGTALSYFFWGQPPDAALLAKMNADRLRTEADIRAEVERLRASPTHAAWMGRFFQQWTHVDDLADKDHDLAKYPDTTRAYKAEAQEALLRQVAALLARPGATFEELLPSRSFVAGPLTAKAYRPNARPAGFQTVEAEPGRRGLFVFLVRRLALNTAVKRPHFQIVKGQYGHTNINHRGIISPGADAATDPVRALDLLFGAMPAGQPAPMGDQPARLLRVQKLYVERLRGELRAMRGVLDAANRELVEKHLASLSDLESSFQLAFDEAASGRGARSCKAPERPAAAMNFQDMSNLARTSHLFFDVAAAALACDRTRVITMQYLNNSDNATYLRHLPNSAFHGRALHDHVAHATGMGYGSAGHVALNLEAYQWFMEAYAELLLRLKAANLLDHTTVLFNIDMSGGNHSFTPPIPLVVAGGGGRKADGSRVLKTGRYLKFAREPHTKLLLTLAHAMGATDVEAFGTVTGRANEHGLLPGMLA